MILIKNILKTIKIYVSEVFVHKYRIVSTNWGRTGVAGGKVELSPKSLLDLYYTVLWEWWPSR